MPELSSPRWGELHDAYGNAARIPWLLQQLSDLPADEDDAEPWFSLWSALAHQGDVYAASFAAVPYVISELASAPHGASEVYFHFPARIEICRHKNGVMVPDELKEAYADALARLPALVAAAAAGRPWSTALSACALAAVAAAKGQHEQAEVLLEMSSSETTEELLEWMDAR